MAQLALKTTREPIDGKRNVLSLCWIRAPTSCAGARANPLKRHLDDTRNALAVTHSAQRHIILKRPRSSLAASLSLSLSPSKRLECGYVRAPMCVTARGASVCPLGPLRYTRNPDQILFWARPASSGRFLLISCKEDCTKQALFFLSRPLLGLVRVEWSVTQRHSHESLRESKNK